MSIMGMERPPSAQSYKRLKGVCSSRATGPTDLQRDPRRPTCAPKNARRNPPALPECCHLHARRPIARGGVEGTCTRPHPIVRGCAEGPARVPA